MPAIPILDSFHTSAASHFLEIVPQGALHSVFLIAVSPMTIGPSGDMTGPDQQRTGYGPRRHCLHYRGINEIYEDSIDRFF